MYNPYILTRNIAIVWSIVFIGIVLYSFAWFVFGRMLMTLIGSIEASYSFPEPSNNTVEVIKYVIAWHPLVAMFGWILYGLLNSMKRDRVTYEQM